VPAVRIDHLVVITVSPSLYSLRSDADLDLDQVIPIASGHHLGGLLFLARAFVGGSLVVGSLFVRSLSVRESVVDLLVVKVVGSMAVVLVVRLVDSNVLQGEAGEKTDRQSVRARAGEEAGRRTVAYPGPIRDDDSSVSGFDGSLGSGSGDRGGASEGEDGKGDSSVDEHLSSLGLREEGVLFRPAKGSWI
jgi:hypothetical protein